MSSKELWGLSVEHGSSVNGLLYYQLWLHFFDTQSFVYKVFLHLVYWEFMTNFDLNNIFDMNRRLQSQQYSNRSLNCGTS